MDASDQRIYSGRESGEKGSDTAMFTACNSIELIKRAAINTVKIDVLSS